MTGWRTGTKPACSVTKPSTLAGEILDAALNYRSGDAFYAWFDLQAALDGVPGAVSRFGSDKAALTEALLLLEE